MWGGSSYNDPPVADCQTELSSCRTELAVITMLIKRIQGQGKKLFWAWECRTISHSHSRFLFHLQDRLPSKERVMGREES